MDRFYVLLNSSYLLGMRRTSLVLSEQSQRWEIVERVDRARVLAATQSSQFPLGRQSWTFTDSNCSDPGSLLRSISMFDSRNCSASTLLP